MSSQPHMDERVLFIGGGNMAEALISGMLRTGLAEAGQLHVTDIQPDRLAYLRAAYGVDGSSDPTTAMARADITVLSVKPQTMPEVLQTIQAHATSRHLLISIAAGFPLARIENALPTATRVVRAMPNTPALVGRGITALCGGQAATETDLVLAERLMRAAGQVVRVDESRMDAVTAVSGSGPAYVFYLMEAMLRAAHELGLPREIADALVVDTVEGAACLARETGQSPETLRQRVTSKGGTTAAALSVMDEHHLFEHLVEAIHAAKQRAAELSSGE